MKKTLWFTAIVICLLYSPPTHAGTSLSIAGFVMGTNIKQYQDLVRMDSVLSIRHLEFLNEVETKKLEGYKNGYITFGTCAHPGRIVKVKLKYEIQDRWFFDELLSRFKKKYGEPSEWKGDPFQTLIAWKWSVKDAQNAKVTMILQHYSGDDEEYTRGNSLRITMRDLIAEERRCYEKAHPEAPRENETATVKLSPQERDSLDYRRFIPE